MPNTGATPVSIIHISDLHCTARSHTLGQIADGILHRDFQDSGTKLNRIASYLTTNRQRLGSNTVIITGDLTDSGDEEDYADPKNGVLQFITRLRSAGFDVFAVPGNHDYCKEGNQFLTGQGNEGEQARRQRFIQLITPQYAASPKYPHIEEIKRPDGSLGARLILLDSMQEELDGNTANNRAQGTLGAAQLDKLRAKLAELQADRDQGIKVIAAIHHSPFYDSTDLALSDAGTFKSVIAGKIDCLIFGHVTRDSRYQAPRYVSKTSYEPEDADIAEGQASLNIPLINVENLEFMGSTLPISVLDVANSTRSVYYLMPYLIRLHKVVCDEPATSLGDDLQIYVDNNPITPAILADINVAPGAIPNTLIQTAENIAAHPRDEMKIDKGQTHDLTAELGTSNHVALSFVEDGDPAGSATIDAKTAAGKGEQILSFKIKDDGRYRLFYSVTPTVDEHSEGGSAPFESWHPWFRVSNGVAALRSPVTALSREPNHLDLFVTGTDRGIYSIYWDSATGWAPSWFRIREGVAQPGSAVTAIARNPAHLDLFVTGTDGGIYWTYWDGATGWAPSWFRIGEVLVRPTSAVTAIARNPNHLDLFVTGSDDGIYSIDWDGATEWAPSWFRVREGVAESGSAVTAIARNPNHLDLFVTGKDGGIYSTWRDSSE